MSIYIYISIYVLIYISIYHIGWLDDFRPLTVATATRVTYQTVSSQATFFSRALLAVNMRNNSAKPGKYGYVQEGCHVFCFFKVSAHFQYISYSNRSTINIVTSNKTIEELH